MTRQLSTGRPRLGLPVALCVMLAALAVLALLAGLIAWLNVRGEAPLSPNLTMPATASAAQVERGRYLALAGNCAGCHTVPGGAAYAGGPGLSTPFGTLYGGNLTPDEQTGLGRWHPDHFWRALHHGRSRDGRLLYPAFPYTSFTHITREDSDALYAWLRTLPPVRQANRPHELAFPYNTQAALAVWRALYFRPQSFTPSPQHSADWNRGAYLVNGLGHCVACHGTRNSWGALDAGRTFGGGWLDEEGWYAPALDDGREAGVQRWSQDDVIALLKTGRNSHAGTSGPMADVVFNSTQHLSDADLQAMAHYLKALPEHTSASPPPPPASTTPPNALLLRGERIYDQQCAWCHGDKGQGQPDAFPPLAGNRALNLRQTQNLVQIIRHGGYLPATQAHPQPHGMPPFDPVLNDADLAAVLSYVRQSWGNTGGAVSPHEVLKR